MKDNFEIVVAHYNEDLERLKPYAKNVVIYHKGKEDSPRFKCKKREKIPNIGREAHTYLYHIVNNYENLSEYTLFFQGGIDDHISEGTAYPSINDYLEEVKKYGFSTSYLFLLLKKKNQITYSGKFKDMVDSGSLKKSDYSFSKFFERLMKKKQKFIIPFFYCANFGVSRDFVIAKDLPFYKDALQLIPTHSNPEESHYYERLWFSIFVEKLNFHFIIKIFKSHMLFFKSHMLYYWNAITKKN